VAAGELKEDCFDVLARAQTIDAKVGAGTGELAGEKIADFHLVGHATRRFDFKVGENRVIRVEVGDAVAFLASAQLAFEDFVGVGRAPISGVRQGGVPAFPAGCFRF
jgi:hypothetical protein